MKVLSLFTGIGAFEKALKNIGIDYELIGFSEIDKYAIKSYCAIHNVSEEKNLGDITKIDITKLPKDIDLITHGSPCQDFSVAGKQAGGDLGTGTRSSLMWNTINIVTYCKPKYVIWENVKNLLSKKHRHNFDSYLSIMESLGYNNYYDVLNAKDYGIPQNRERVYTVSIRKDIDNGKFLFPEKEILKLRLKDMLEDKVDEKYYLDNAKIKNYNRNFGSKGKVQDEICDTLQAAMGNGGGNVPIIKCIQVGELEGGPWDKRIESCKRVYSEEGISPTISSCQGGGTEPKVLRIGGIFDTEKSKHQAGSIYDKEQLAPTLDAMQGGYRQPMIEVIGNYSPSNHEASRIVNSNGLAPTVKENHGTVTATNVDYKIRKLTPKECWRLMGFTDEDFEKAANVPTSNTQLYKQAGNSIVVNVLEKIFKNLFKGE